MRSVAGSGAALIVGVLCTSKIRKDPGEGEKSEGRILTEFLGGSEGHATHDLQGQRASRSGLSNATFLRYFGRVGLSSTGSVYWL